MSYIQGSETNGSCLVIFFPEDVEIEDRKCNHYLYGFASGNMYVTIHVTKIHVEDINREEPYTGDEEEWNNFRILGELSFVTDMEELGKENCAEKRGASKHNYIYLLHCKNKPMFVRMSSEEDKNVSALFILYNVKKYVYNINVDHVNDLVADAFNRREIYIKGTNKKEEKYDHVQKKYEERGSIHRYKVGDDNIYSNCWGSAKGQGEKRDGYVPDEWVATDGEVEGETRLKSSNKNNCTEEVNEHTCDAEDPLHVEEKTSFRRIAEKKIELTLYMTKTIELINRKHVYVERLKKDGKTSKPCTLKKEKKNNPLGLKLNNNFTSFIGSAIVSILDKWDYFKNIFPLRSSVVVDVFRVSSLLGFSFFLSLLIDYIKLITAHVSLIFFFLKKLCSIFHSNIYSLYLLFNGKKWNILKLRVDTNYYTNEEVILGTILFTILIFLYPTVLVLFSAFGIIYFMINRFTYSLSIVKDVILYSPFYILFLRSSSNKYISKGIKLTKYHIMEEEKLKGLPKSHYLLLENVHFMFSDKVKLFKNIFFNHESCK
ncbi:phosphatidylinositol N-acetylglucosaminyltransferase subunit GPI1, putative [Plasmodium ovale wallikeri]|uniref:Phosphatidylinositol N-acetylglucosaminyltransferase subunit GPI1, putative n=1 Tax=Plasmodium ovale wallikeri TaxID=864142 RepID=A0A1A8Z2Z7_PLAOA|nr:phosphatidylinositol N-acetylglucosaminyltransferase subunit GPI1, putative [Plasmodium ovale wallikeri]SBT38942.1 phosphatidylinositol N-acetylglucosaminyltransferase subunit GPI1, putative [Plasmodium ovale wallikeri]